LSTADLKSFNFQTNKLDATFKFNFNGGYEKQELCFQESSEISLQVEVCVNMLNQSIISSDSNGLKKFNGLAFNNQSSQPIIDYGKSFSFYIMTTGCAGKNVTKSNTVNASIGKHFI
jgi:hypothetical protein